MRTHLDVIYSTSKSVNLTLHTHTHPCTHIHTHEHTCMHMYIHRKNQEPGPTGRARSDYVITCPWSCCQTRQRAPTQNSQADNRGPRVSIRCRTEIGNIARRTALAVGNPAGFLRESWRRCRRAVGQSFRFSIHAYIYIRKRDREREREREWACGYVGVWCVWGGV